MTTRESRRNHLVVPVVIFVLVILCLQDGPSNSFSLDKEFADFANDVVFGSRI